MEHCETKLKNLHDLHDLFTIFSRSQVGQKKEVKNGTLQNKNENREKKK